MKKSTLYCRALLLLGLCLTLCGCVASKQTDAPASTVAAAPTLPPHYPAAFLPLPKDSAVMQFTAIADGEKQSDYVTFTTSMKKQEAAEYFEPLLEKDADYYFASESDLVPLDIQGAFPSAAGGMELFARYALETAPASVSGSRFTPWRTGKPLPSSKYKSLTGKSRNNQSARVVRLDIV